MVLALINAVTTAVVFVAIGMPYWLPLALWTGVVAQFVPTVGTYIAIVLPVVVGLLTPQPWLGVAALVWAVLYQQVENLLIEPRISARAVDVNPAVSFGAVLLGAALFGAAGAFLAVPVIAMLLALLNIYGRATTSSPKSRRPSLALRHLDPPDHHAASGRPKVVEPGPIRPHLSTAPRTLSGPSAIEDGSPTYPG